LESPGARDFLLSQESHKDDESASLIVTIIMLLGLSAVAVNYLPHDLVSNISTDCIEITTAGVTQVIGSPPPEPETDLVLFTTPN